MNPLFTLASAYLVLSSAMSFAEQNDSSIHSTPYAVIGKAYSLKSGELLYQEIHRTKESMRTVTYMEADGTVFANKSINYALSSHQPSFEQTNDRNGEFIKVIQQGKDILITYKASRDEADSTKQLTLTPNMIIDAGFDPFIKEHWQPLLEGEKFDLDYVVPSKKTTFGFRFGLDKCLENTKDGSVCFSLSPTSWLVKMAVDPIVVAYEENTKRLVRFTGRANISNAKGKYENVDIRYQYP
ncbi:hypothetical protein OFY17_11570 [Marinomonas sp. C2222]|uniref:DUF3108 domain-containing protein n=1 Tax=Marinomonas sargassi TaxID=2984494 RepID=A0ABT2YUG2_9GAMM|nr:hypothetical protein [Marinomonas sargassi]MCV2403511.1 hypothetical protein [Marinomonas sargassi]